MQAELDGHTGRSGVLTQLSPFLQQCDHDRGVPAADGPVQRPHPAKVHMLDYRSPLHQILDLHMDHRSVMQALF